MSIVFSYEQDCWHISTPKQVVLVEKGICRMLTRKRRGDARFAQAAGFFGKRTPLKKDQRWLRIAPTTALFEV
jgi:hypothetical protein